MKKPIKYVLIVAVLGLSVYNAIFIKKLDEIKTEKSNSVFNAKTFASNFMATKVETLPAIKATVFLDEAKVDPKNYAESKGNKLGISYDYYFIIEGNATVLSVEEEDVLIALTNQNQDKLKIATDFIFGNAIREGAKVANIGDFQNTMDYNNISVELNTIVREKIVPKFIKNINAGDIIYFKGAVKINTKNPNLQDLRVIPMLLKINN